MISVAAARALIVALEGVTAAPHGDREAFRAGGRMFASLRGDGLLNVHLPIEEQELRCKAAPRVFTPVAGGWGRMGFTTVNLDRAEIADLQSALLAAWRASRPKLQSGPKKREKR